MKNLNIRVKVFFAVGLALVLIFSLVMYLLVTESTNQLKSDLNRESKSFASLATTPIGNEFILYSSSGSALINQQINSYLTLDSDVSSVSIVSINGNTLYSDPNNNSSRVSVSQASAFQPVYQKTSSGYINQIIQPLVESGGVHRYAIVYRISTKRVEQNVTNVIQLILVIGLAVLVLSIAGTSLLLNRLFINPIRALSKSADTISSGKYDEQIVAKNKDEIGVLANSLNKMAGSLKADIIKLKDLDEMKSEFMMVTSHNLRTPLTIIRGYIELAASESSVDGLKKTIATISQSVGQLNILAENMLTISSLEAGSTMNREPIQIQPFISSIDNEFQPIALKQKLNWQFKNDIDSNATININQANLHSALTSLIDNAIKFTKEGGNVSINASFTDNQLKFTVQDNGIGIDSDELPKLFTKFHRGTDTMQYDYEGVGIGLYLSKLIIDQHGGSITIESKKGEGTSCVVLIPNESKEPLITETKQPPKPEAQSA
jgi:signal transduction histidine kinase